MLASLEQGWHPPPLVVAGDAERLTISDGAHRHAALLRAGHERYWAIFHVTERRRDDLIARIGPLRSVPAEPEAAPVTSAPSPRRPRQRARRPNALNSACEPPQRAARHPERILLDHPAEEA